MDTDTHETPTTAAPDDAPAKKKDGAVTLTVVLMLLALACVGITAAIAFYDMSQ